MRRRVLPLIWTSLLVAVIHPCPAQSENVEFKLEGLPSALAWEHPPASWEAREGSLRITAGAKTDLFRDPRGEYAVDNAPAAFFSPDEEFILSALVRVEFESDYDAGALIVYVDRGRWAKLALELSPQKTPTLVSVVNREVSDDANHRTVDGRQVRLRVAGLGGGAYAFHYSMDGMRWHLLRYFSFGSAVPARVGFASQSPLGSSCRTEFTEINYRAEKLADIRNEK